MALTDLLTALEADADDETRRLRVEADGEATRIVESARAEARALEHRASRSHEGALVHDFEQRRSEARLAAAAVLREAHESCVVELQSAARGRLGELRHADAYGPILRALVEEGLAAIPDASALRVDPRDARLAQAIVDELGLPLELKAELDTLGGVEVAAEDGRTARNTFEERLRNAEPELRLLAGRLLRAAAAEHRDSKEAVQ